MSYRSVGLRQSPRSLYRYQPLLFFLPWLSFSTRTRPSGTLSLCLPLGRLCGQCHTPRHGHNAFCARTYNPYLPFHHVPSTHLFKSKATDDCACVAYVSCPL
ncbi:hypothetical protein BJV74DRAFT_335068 [Russula compacta]|nr:hypothetical protein BJV74DRAFT_335068 [Russula compacta]